MSKSTQLIVRVTTLNFYFPSSGIRTTQEHICFMETILPVVKEELLAITSLPRQIGALYLFYALFHKQPLQHFVHMRITPADSAKLTELFQVLNSRPQIHRQPLLVFSRLWRQDAAFLWVAEETEQLKVLYAETSRSKWKGNAEKVADFEPLNLRREMEDVLDREEGLIAGMEVLEVAYNEMKEELGRNDPMLDPSTVCATINESIDKIAGLLNKVDVFTTGRHSENGEAKEQEGKKMTRKETRRERVLKKISEIQKSKNTLKEETVVKDEVVIVEENELQIDTSFLCRPTQKKPLSYATKCAKMEEEDEQEEEVHVRPVAVVGKGKGKKRKAKKAKPQSKKAVAASASPRRSKRRRLK